MTINKNINAIIELEKLKGSNITNITQYNHAVQSQVIQHRYKAQLLKHKNLSHMQVSTITSPLLVKSFNCKPCD